MNTKIIPFDRRGGEFTAVADIIPTARPGENVPQPLRVVESKQCPKCHGDGWLRIDVPFGHPQFGKTKKCACKEDEQVRKNRMLTFRWLGQPEDQALEMEALSFAGFRPRYSIQVGEKRHLIDFSRAYQDAYSYAELVKTQQKGQKNVIFVGNPGAGKTHLAGSILNVLREAGVACLFTTAPGFFRALYAADFEEKDHLLREAQTTPVLVVDDLDKLHVKASPDPGMKAGSYQKSVLFDLFDARYVAKLPTIITTNEEDDLSRWLDKAVISRLFGRMIGIEMSGADYRQIAGR